MRAQREATARIRRVAARALALTLVLTGTVALTPSPVGALPTEVSVAAIYAGRYDSGLSESFIVRRGSYERFDVSGSAQAGLTVDLQSPDDYRRTYRLQFAAPAGQELQAGAYEGARPLFNRADGQPGFQVGDQYACPAGVGRFEVLDMSADLSRFRIVFEQRCSSGAQSSFGEIRYNMPGDSEFLVSASRIAFPATTFDEGERSVRVKLMNTGNQPVDVTGVGLAGPGAVAFQAVDGCTQHVLPRLSWCWVDVVYNPVVTVPQQATVTITTTQFGTHTVDLSGPGLSADDPVFTRSVGTDPDPVENVQATPHGRSITVTWNNPRNVDFADTVLRIAPGTTPPATPDDGIEVYAGSAPSAEVGGLEAGTPYSYSLFARDVEGRYSRPFGQTIGGVKVTVNYDHKALPYGTPLVLSGYLSDAESGRPIEFAPITVLAYDRTDGEYYLAAEDKAYAGGAYQVALSPGQNYEYVVVFPGDFAHLGGAGLTPMITVGMGVQIKPVRKFVQEGKPLQLLIWMDPLNPGQNVILERQIKGKWKKFTSFKVAKKNPLKVSINAKEGNYNFRAVRAGDRRHAKGTSNRVNMQVIGRADP